MNTKKKFMARTSNDEKTQPDHSELSQRSADSSHRIVQCPNCQAKYAVAAHILRKQEVLRFHCSRCDSIFTREEGGENVEIDQVSTDSATQSNPAGHSQFAAERRHAPAAADVFEKVVAPPDQHGEGLGDLMEEPALLGDDVPEPPSLAAPRAQSTQRAPQPRGLEIPRGYVRSWESSAPHENPAPAAGSQDSLEPSQMELSFKDEKRGYGSVFKRPASNAREANPWPFSIQSTPWNEGAESAYRDPVNTLGLSAYPEGSPSYRRYNPWKAFLVLAVPIVAFLFILIGLSYAARSSTNTNSLVVQLFPELPQAAPTELMLKDLNFKRVNLDNGERVYIVTGKISNQTERTFREVILEGLAFDSLGRNIAKVRVNAGSGLARARIKSLSSSMITNLQTQPPALRYELAPGKQQEISIAFVGYSLPDLAYYSARIYSVK